jgi:hypothetical protein
VQVRPPPYPVARIQRQARLEARTGAVHHRFTRPSLGSAFALRRRFLGWHSLVAGADLHNRGAWMVRHAPLPGLAAGLELPGLDVGPGDDEIAFGVAQRECGHRAQGPYPVARIQRQARRRREVSSGGVCRSR